MSAETMTWLNTMTRIGYVSRRGTAWHHRANLQDGQSNHYDGPVPVTDAHELLDQVRLAEGDVQTTYMTADGVTRLTDPTRKTIVRAAGSFGGDDLGAVLGVFKKGYSIHPYGEWLIKNLQMLLDNDELGIGSVGLLRGGGLAWVQVEMDDTITTPEGVQHRPFITAATSVDGTLSSTYQRGTQLVVCDNTLSASLGEAGASRIRIKHSANSLDRVQEVRDALGIVHQVADDFAAEVKALCETEVPDATWRRFLDLHVELDPSKGKAHHTKVAQKRDVLTHLYREDERSAPWTGTAFGVLQAVNTWSHHHQTVKGASRGTRNTERMVTGEFRKIDAATLSDLDRALAAV